MYLNVSKCIFVLYCMYCMYFLQPKVLGGGYIQDTYNTYTYAHDTYRYNFNTYKIHTKYMQIHTAKLVAQKVHIACIRMYPHVSFFNAYVHVCVCMVCMCLYVYVFKCICAQYTCTYALFSVRLQGVHMCMYVYVFCDVFSHVCPLYLHVLYVLAQPSTDAVPASPKGPLLGWHPAGPTQGTPGQVADHFIPPSGTHARTRFGAPARTARVGGVQSAPPAQPTDSPHAFRARRSRPKPRLR